MPPTDSMIYRREWTLTAGETDARGLMPVTLIASRAIEIATLHANALGIGYSNLAEHHLGWVLARLTIEIDQYPVINERYSMETWIEGYNRYFSDRCYTMLGAADRPLAHIRSVWVAIDTRSRTLADLSGLRREAFAVADRECPVARTPKPAIATDTTPDRAEYTFRYRDIDFNRHVNTIRYLDAVLNLRPLDFYDTHDIVRLDATFDHECLFGERVDLLTAPDRRDPADLVTEIRRADGRRAVAVALRCVSR